MALTTVRPQGMGFVTGRRNLIINGAMQVSQRATAATDTAGESVYRTLDRLVLWEATDGAFTSEQSTEAPDGFSNSVKLACTTADTSLAATQYAAFGQIVEAQNLQHLAYGTNAAQTITVSFYVRSNKTGTYCLCVDKHDSTSYKFVKEFTINSADTWERKTITIEPDSQIKASAGAIANDNGLGLRFIFGLAWGSTYAAATDNVWSSDGNDFATSNQVNWMDSTSTNFYFTGFQVEIGENASDFEHRSYGEELSLCHRYFQKDIRLVAWNVGSGESTSACNASYHTPMRVVPTGTRTAGGGLTSTTPTNAYYYATAMLIYSSSANACSGLYDLDAEL